MPGQDSQATIDAIATLAEEIARANPDCAEKAMQIVKLAKGLEGRPDYLAIEDAIEAGTEGGLSDTEVRSASLEVARTVRDEP
ncbi:MAG TPA: hypothetical protein VKA80_02055 [Beijerinckiaceae bacterium]|jgi:hypothetical protein|nr:hypothetical protein [Beijerinckiaceae bacterium]